MLQIILDAITSVSSNDRGQALAEYALVLAVIAIGCLIAVGLLGTTLVDSLIGFAESIRP